MTTMMMMMKEKKLLVMKKDRFEQKVENKIRPL